VRATIASRVKLLTSRPSPLMAGVLVPYLVAYVLVWALLHRSTRATTLDTLNMVGPLLATLFCALAAYKAANRDLRRFWALVGASMFASALAEATWAYYELAVGRTTPFPSAADFFWLLSYPLEFWAIVSLVSIGGRERLSSLGVVLEAFVFAVATALVTWQFVMLPSLDPQASGLANAVSIGYPGGDILLLAALASLALIPLRKTLPRGLIWVAIACVVDVTADFAFAGATNSGDYATGAWMDILWPLAYVLTAAAAVRQFTRPRTGTMRDSLMSHMAARFGPNLKEEIRTAVPYAALPVAGFVILYSQTHPGQPAYLYTLAPLSGVILLVALVLARQYITLAENQRLRGSLAALSGELDDKEGQRIKELAVLDRVASTMALSPDTRQALRIAGLLHDVGWTPPPEDSDAYVSLNEEQLRTIRRNAVLGKLASSEMPSLGEALAAVATHHERYDGAGYPQGLSGDHIPLLGRLLALADAYTEAVVGNPDRDRQTTTGITDELTRQAGGRLDPLLVDAFVRGLLQEDDPSAPEPV
jgi:hypothetical protein